MGRVQNVLRWYPLTGLEATGTRLLRDACVMGCGAVTRR